MSDDSTMTEQLRQLTLDEQAHLEATSSELRQLLDAADKLVASLDNDVQPAYDSTITEILLRAPESDEPATPAAGDLGVEPNEDGADCDPVDPYLT